MRRCFWAGTWARPRGGAIVGELEGEFVEAGMLLATITDLHGEMVAEMRAPHPGLVAGVRSFVSVNPGDHVFALFPRIG